MYVFAVLFQDADPYVPYYLERIYKRRKDAEKFAKGSGEVYIIRKLKVR